MLITFLPEAIEPSGNLGSQTGGRLERASHLELSCDFAPGQAGLEGFIQGGPQDPVQFGGGERVGDEIERSVGLFSSCPEGGLRSAGSPVYQTVGVGSRGPGASACRVKSPLDERDLAASSRAHRKT